jgi:cyclohexanone monooxygenase
MFGPNIGTVSGFVMAEAQASYVFGALLERRRRGLASIEVRPAEQAAFVAQVDRVLATSTFTVGGCHSYYQSDAGNRISLVWPWTMRTMRRRLRRFDLAPYDTTPEPAATARR